MIARIWHGVTAASKADEYIEYVKATGLKDYEKTEGNLGAFLLRRLEGDKAHFLTLSFWTSFDAIRKFAGEQYEQAVYYPEDEAFLLEFEEKVVHYEIVDGANDLPWARALRDPVKG